MAGSLHDDLVAIRGIDTAELEGDPRAPSGVRVRLAVGADAGQVGDEVRRVLAEHGMRSQMIAAHPEPPEQPAPVVNLADYESTETSMGPSDTGPDVMTKTAESATVLVTPPLHDKSEAPVLDSVTVRQDRDVVTVSITSSDGRTATRQATRSAATLHEATVHAAAQLATSQSAPPRVVVVRMDDVEATTFVTVLLERPGGRRCVGAATIDGSVTYAVAAATWAALTDPLQA